MALRARWDEGVKMFGMWWSARGTPVAMEVQTGGQKHGAPGFAGAHRSPALAPVRTRYPMLGR
jgi:hypothetical protein